MTSQAPAFRKFPLVRLGKFSQLGPSSANATFSQLKAIAYEEIHHRDRKSEVKDNSPLCLHIIPDSQK